MNDEAFGFSPELDAGVRAVLTFEHAVVVKPEDIKEDTDTRFTVEFVN